MMYALSMMPQSSVLDVLEVARERGDSKIHLQKKVWCNYGGVDRYVKAS